MRNIWHVGIHDSANKNAGDTLLFSCVRRTFDALLEVTPEWSLKQVWEVFDRREVDFANKNSLAVVVGGGGLLLRDQQGADTSRSGWQWNSDIDAIARLEVPLIVFAVGYNRFREQPDFDPVFTAHINQVVEKASFFGLRNSGSIRKVSGYLRSGLAAKMTRQYCPTTLAWQLYPEFRVFPESAQRTKKRLAFNAAFDRLEYRFSGDYRQSLSLVAEGLRRASLRGWQIICVAHKTMDRNFEQFLGDLDVDFLTKDLTLCSPEEVLSFYSHVDCAVGMRGHAQMIPFGLRKPIVSLISHDKMGFFLEDLQKPDWGIEVDDPLIADKLEFRLEQIFAGRDSFAEVSDCQEQVWNETLRNFQGIANILGLESKGA